MLLFTQPVLTPTSAFFITFSFAATYVGGLYLSKNTRTIFASVQYHGDGKTPREKLREERWRNDPDVIRARIIAVMFSTFACCLAVFAVLWKYSDGMFNSAHATLRRLGFLSPGSLLPFDIWSYSAHFVTPILFLGPLFGSFLGGQLPWQKNWSWNTHVHLKFFSIQGIRDYCVGPITEEIVFRGCVLAIYHLAGSSTKRIIFFAPLTFGLAHVHHAWDTYNRYGRNLPAAKRALIGCVFQLEYTTIFGIHVSYLFLRTGSVWPTITAHIFCNIMGVPVLGYELRRFKEWKTAIITTYIAGIVGFVYTLARWTRTPGNFYWPLDGDNLFVNSKY